MNLENLDPWTRFFDDEQKAYYWYNSKTGESRWEDNNNYEQERTNELNIESQSLIHQEEIPKKKKVKNKKGSKASKDFYISQEDIDKEEEIYEFKSYEKCVIINALIFENIGCLLESFFRSLLLIILLIVIMIFDLIIFRNYLYRKEFLKQIARDLLLTIGICLSLLVPGLIWYVYREYSSSGTWSLNSLPTLFGKADCRRFGTITLVGAGVSAENISIKQIDKEKDRSLDSWENSIAYYPRDVIQDIKSFVEGRNQIDSLGIKF